MRAALTLRLSISHSISRPRSFFNSGLVGKPTIGLDNLHLAVFAVRAQLGHIERTVLSRVASSHQEFDSKLVFWKRRLVHPCNLAELQCVHSELTGTHSGFHSDSLANSELQACENRKLLCVFACLGSLFPLLPLHLCMPSLFH